MTDGMDSVVAQIRWAAEAVTRADVSDDLRPAAFEHALRLAPSARRGGGTWELPVVEASVFSAGAAERPIERIAAELELHEDAVGQVFDEDDHGSVRLGLSRSRLPASRAAAMRNVAVTLAVGRQLVRPEEATPFRLLREECDELGVLDGPNFATELRRLDLRVSGGRNARVAKVRRDHHETVRRLIESLIATGTLLCVSD